MTTRNRAIEFATRHDLAPFIIDIHYAHRFPSISKAWKLMVNGVCEGVVCYGRPGSAPLRNGVCGPDMAGSVWELNRLCLKGNHSNDASWLVAASLRMMGDAIVVSYADASHGHVGYVYQACGFLYTGLSAKRTDWQVKGMEGKHGLTVADEFRGVPNRSGLMREKYGDAFYLMDRPRKHRYVKAVGSKSFRRIANRELRYKVEAYPKESMSYRPNQEVARPLGRMVCEPYDHEGLADSV